MRLLTLLTTVTLLSVATAARAQAPTVEAPTTQAPAAQAPAEERMPMFGVGFDVGVPDGIGLQAYFRPIPFLRLQLGPVSNIAAFGIRGGVSIVPFQWVVAPSLTFEGGHYFPGDVARAVRMFGASIGSPELEQALRHLSYTFGNMHLGLEIGSPRSVQFFLHFGLSYVVARVYDAQNVVRTATDDQSIEMTDPIIRFTAPSLKLGLAFFFG